ncbi:MAG: cellulose synthase catalytic subunit [Bacteroidota bacterium]|nr:cellulose synthase catalytic subunit [Candidatus Kapabacteria bacterium]MDW8220306.1 cellulose synthase catalytic subunit [Bacteroidota bacterium]
MGTYYFQKFEHRTPPSPLPHSPLREAVWQFLATIALTLGAWYILWRWTSSINTQALWFALPLVCAETCAYIGLILFAFNLWKVEDTPQQAPPRFIRECVRDEDALHSTERPVAVDVFFPTYNEDVELVRMGIRDAKALRYPHPIDINIYVLDDGRRDAMRCVAEEEQVHYITRTNNVGFKAGNLRHAMEQTSGDFIVICDADTRPFPTLLEHTLGYFRDPDVAWVQTPQWFFDLTEGVPLKEWMLRRFSYAGYLIGASIEAVCGTILIGHDRFVNDPRMFFDVIQRRRNWANASFCCGAGSIHRREAVMQAAMKTYADAIDGEIRRFIKDIHDEEIRHDLADAMRKELALETEVIPYKFHVSEDIYTSIVLHSYEGRRWKSIFHPQVESKMLSPQDLLSWTIQRFKYAGGSLDIFFHDNPIFRRSAMTLAQRTMYMATFYSYLSGVWNVIFLCSPIVYLFSEISPVQADTLEFAKHFLPFMLTTELAFLVGTWGIPSWQGMASYLSFFPINLRALWTVLRGEKIRFPVTPKDRQEGNFLHLVIPQLSIITLTALGLVYAGMRLYTGISHNYAGFIVNLFWGTINICAMSGIVAAALWKPPSE